MVGYLNKSLLQICHQKDFQNQLIFGEVMDKSLVSCFLTHRVILAITVQVHAFIVFLKWKIITHCCRRYCTDLRYVQMIACVYSNQHKHNATCRPNYKNNNNNCKDAVTLYSHNGRKYKISGCLIRVCIILSC